MLKIYIAGKINGDENYREKFENAERLLSREGHAVLNPASLPCGMSSEDYMAICWTMLSRADIVVFLPDWEESRGASMEHAYCEYTGKEFILL